MKKILIIAIILFTSGCCNHQGNITNLLRSKYPGWKYYSYGTGTCFMMESPGWKSSWRKILVKGSKCKPYIAIDEKLDPNNDGMESFCNQ